MLLPFLYSVLLISISIYQSVAHYDHEQSVFQFFRASPPFFYGCIILVGYNRIYTFFSRNIQGIGGNHINLLYNVMLFFAIGQLVQVVAFKFGLRIANYMLSSGDDLSYEAGRIFLFPQAASLLIFFYACYQHKLLLMAVLALVLLASGSKIVIVTMLLMYILASFKRFALKSVILNILSVAVIAVLILYASPNAAERLTDFVEGDKLEDATRVWEVFYAKSSFLSGYDNMIFGSGFASAITPGVDSIDPGWSENSKYDIENGYWAILTKIGILGTLLYVGMFLCLPRNLTMAAIIVIELVSALGSQSLFFTKFEGPYLFAWSIVINYLLLHDRPRFVGLRAVSERAEPF